MSAELRNWQRRLTIEERQMARLTRSHRMFPSSRGRNWQRRRPPASSSGCLITLIVGAAGFAAAATGIVHTLA